jgi:hypothetical protein
MKRSPKARARARMVNALDADARQRVFERDNGRCIFAGYFGIKCSGQVQWAHVLSRRHPALRWEEINGMSLCSGHHLYWHHEPAIAVERFVSLYPERWAQLQRLHLLNPKINIREKFEALK